MACEICKQFDLEEPPEKNVVEDHPGRNSIMGERSQGNDEDQSRPYSLCVADALGVPAESRTRKYLKKHPITGMVGGGLHGQPAGYWSDDSSMTLCLADSIGKVGYYYGYESIPAEWIDALVNKELIEECINRLEEHVDGLWDCF